MTILYIEDNKTNQIIVQKSLGKDHQVTIASTADEGIALGRANQYDMIIIDLNLNNPQIDGFGVLTALKATPSTEKSVFIAHTSYINEGVEQKCHAAGFDIFYPKPFRIKDFKKIMDTL